MEKHGVRLGSLVGAVFGLVFVLVNAAGLPGALALRALAVVAFAAVVAALARSTTESPAPTAGAIRTYWLCVLAEVLAIPVGAQVLTGLDEPDLVLCWVVLVVGVHFLPFARAFRAPVFTPLGLALVLLAMVGAVGVLADLDDAQLWTAVGAGFVLLAFAAYGALRRPVAPA
ncbi:hypothetical protein [Nocardioides plantarum]|uniref:Uncharacterized protein n=1 Tax=Nocardioides plantarum TaxID=29299 RepID=A0ABV5KD18_9ACTN|nr:hypothetical protein [Nocardioides plantarum]